MRLPLSLPARLSAAVMAVLVAATVAADVMAVRELRRHLAESVSDSLSGMVARLAGQMDQDLAVLKGLLAEEARRLESIRPDEARDLLTVRGPALNFAFDFGVVVVDASGRVVADSRGRDIWRDIDLADQEFFQRGFALRRPLLSQPFAVPTDEQTPLVVLTEPLRDASGRMYALLAGGLDLVHNRLLSQPTGVRASRHGQIGVFTLDGRVVSHSEKQLILDVFENPLEPLDAAAGGRALDIVTADGERAVLAVARLREAEWLVAGVFPHAEIYRPVERGFAAAHRWFAAGLAASCLLVWLVSRATVRDLGLLAREVDAIGLRAGAADDARAGQNYRGEAGMLAGAINAMLASLAAARKDIDELSARLADTEERERRAIAHDLHDSVCQTLALAAMRLGDVKKRAAAPADKAAVDAVKALLEQSVGELKTLLFDLSPGILYELGLLPALEWYAGEFSKKYGLPVTVKGDGGPDGLDDARAIFLYRAAGELLTNAAKHARATAAELTVARDGPTIILTVADDGRGLPPQGGGEGGGGFGLRSLRARARQYQGALSLAPGANGGTVAELRIATADAASERAEG